jgi:hypothetical protein
LRQRWPGRARERESDTENRFELLSCHLTFPSGIREGKGHAFARERNLSMNVQIRLGVAVCFQTHRPKTDVISREPPTNTRNSRVSATKHAGIAIAISQRVSADLNEGSLLERDVPGGGMRMLTRFARYLVPSVLVVGLMSLGAPMCLPKKSGHPMHLMRTKAVARWLRPRPGLP